LVEVLEVFGGCGALEGLEEVVVDLEVVGEVVEDVLRVFFEFACIGLGDRLASVGLCKRMWEWKVP
jgi:hypothetical protein